MNDRGPLRQRGDWPSPASDEDKAAYTAAHALDKKRLEDVLAAEIAVVKEERLTKTKNQDLDLATSDHLERKLHEALLAEASSGVTRVTDNAKYVQTIAAALAGLYATALGITFAVSTNPLPARGFIAPLFFGLAMVETAFYLAFLGDTEGPKRPRYISAAEDNWRRTIYFAKYAVTIAHRRRGWLRAAILALFVGVLFMPSPFLDVSGPAPDDASQRAATADEELPEAPAGNRLAEAARYEKVLAAYGSGEPADATWVPPWKGADPIPYDFALGLLAVAIYLLLLVAAWLLSLFSRSSDAAVAVVTNAEAGSYADKGTGEQPFR